MLIFVVDLYEPCIILLQWQMCVVSWPYCIFQEYYLSLTSLSLSHTVESKASSQSCSAGRLETYFQAVNITSKLNLAMDTTVLGHWKSRII
jgi:hypothetical protein